MTYFGAILGDLVAYFYVILGGFRWKRLVYTQGKSNNIKQI